MDELNRKYQKKISENERLKNKIEILEKEIEKLTIENKTLKNENKTLRYENFEYGVPFFGNETEKKEKVELIIKENLKNSLEEVNLKNLIELLKEIKFYIDEEEKYNILIYNNKVFMNRMFPVMKNEKYIKEYNLRIIDVSDIVNFNQEKLIALYDIKEDYNFIMNHKIYNNTNEINNSWNKFRFNNNIFLKKLITKFLKKYEFKKYYKYDYSYAIFKFMSDCLELGIFIKDKDFNKNTIEQIIREANSIAIEYMKRIKMYIRFFNVKDSEEFEKSFGNLDNVLMNLRKICIKYGKYAHTEKILQYYVYHKKDEANNIHSESLSFTSLIDMCSFCEKTWAQIANENLKVNVLSFH